MRIEVKATVGPHTDRFRISLRELESLALNKFCALYRVARVESAAPELYVFHSDALSTWAAEIIRQRSLRLPSGVAAVEFEVDGLTIPWASRSLKRG